MRTIATVFTLFAVCTSAFGQILNPVKPSKYSIGLNPLSFAMMAFTPHAEVALSNNGGLHAFGTIGWGNEAIGGTMGFALGLEYRHYFNGNNSLSSGYIAPFVRYRDFDVWFTQTTTTNSITTEQKVTAPVNLFSGGFVFGHKKQLGGSKFVTDIFTGISINSNRLNSPSGVAAADEISRFLTLPFGFRLGLSISYRL